MKRSIILALAALALAGCVRAGVGTGAGAPTQPAATGETITYETGPCFGFCPSYTLSVSPDGTAVFKGERHTKVTGEQRFTVTPAQYAAFARKLAPFRPQGEAIYDHGSPLCELAATDMPSVDVRWKGDAGEQHLHFYYGCDMEKNRAMAEALRKAPEVLPQLKAMIGERS